VTVRLREVREADMDALFALQADPVAYEMAAMPPRERADFDAHWQRSLAEDTTLVRAVDVDGECAGQVVSFLREGQDEREIGYWIARSHWGRGVATAALAAFLQEETRRPLIAGVAVHNSGSRRVLEKCGFTYTGTETDPKGDGVDEWRFRLD
jgi:RimJ/RimL family protein N-acetyltransferase